MHFVIVSMIIIVHNHKYFRPKWVSIHGIKFKVGCVLWIGQDKEEMPRFVTLKKICIVKRKLKRIWFITIKLRIVMFNRNFNAYEMSNAAEIQIIQQQELPYPFPLHLIYFSVEGHTKMFVCPKYQLP